MSDESNDWLYSEFGSHPTPRIRIADILKDAGWDDDVRQVYGVFGDDDDEFEDGDLGFDLEYQDRCTCKIVQLFSAADDLKDFLESNTSRFPRSDAHIDSFTSLGGWAHGSWSFYVNAQSSIPFDGENEGSLHLFGCSKKGHSCRVLMNSDGLVYIRAEKPELPSVSAKGTDDEESLMENAEVIDAREAREEELYDRRTYSDLDDSKDLNDDEEDLDMIAIWRDFIAPEPEISTFLGAGLEPEEVIQLSRYMPRNQVALWVEQFGRESMMALEYLKISIGEITEKEQLDDIDLDSLRARLATAVRAQIALEFKKTEKDRRLKRKVNKIKRFEFDIDEDETFDLKNDPYWDD